MVKLVIRLALVALSASLGNLISTPDVPPNFPLLLPKYTRILTTFVCGIIGYFLPDLLVVVTKLGIARLAEDITSRIVSQLQSLPRISPPQLLLSKNTNRYKLKTKRFINPMIVDTSAIIDGRLLEIAGTGFLFGELIIIPSVLGELRHIADSGNDLRRARGRYGLNILEKLKEIKYVKSEILKEEPQGKDVDEKLLKLAKRLKARIITTDFNLNKVARISGVKVLNVNELANAVKTVALPGEEVEVKLIHKGKEKNQGIGYLPDGTMIVVENGAELVGKTVKTKVARILQTPAGRMVFVRLIS